jgi:cytochrome c-type biogenesis protein CcmH
MSQTPTGGPEPLQQLKSLRDAGALSAAEYEAARERVERGLPAPAGAAEAASQPAPPAPPRAGRKLWLLTLSFTVVVGLAGYAVYGEPGAVWGTPAPPQAAAPDGQTPSPQEIAAMVDRLAERLKERPDDAQGWSMLARSYLALDRLEEAAQASERALKLQPDSPQALADHADVLAMKNGRTLEGEPMRLIERALQIDPDHLKSLALAGAAAFDRGNMAEAARLWERVSLLGPPGSDIVQQARDGAAEARRLAAQATGATPAAARVSGPSAGPSASLPAAAAAPARVSGTVTIGESLKSRLQPDDTLFVYARAADGRGMPLAILRGQARDLPLQFTLDDSHAMGPGSGLSTARQVVIGARISRNGQAMPQSGDLEGLSAPVDVGSPGVRVEISRVVP